MPYANYPLHFSDDILPAVVNGWFDAMAGLYRAAPWQEESSTRFPVYVTIGSQDICDAVLHPLAQNSGRRGFALFAGSDDYEAWVELEATDGISEKLLTFTRLELTFGSLSEAHPAVQSELERHERDLGDAVPSVWSFDDNGGSDGAHFRGYDIDVRVARLTLDYLSESVERALTARRRTGEFPPGRMAAYDYRLAFAKEVSERVTTIVSERETEELASSSTGTALTVRKLEIVQRECGQDLRTSTVRGRGAIDDAAAGAGRDDGSRVSLDPQVGSRGARPLLGSD